QKKDATDIEIAEAKIYRDKDGKMGIPQQNVFAMLKHAGRRVPYGAGKSKCSTAESTFLPEFLRLKATSVDEGGDPFFLFDNLDKSGNLQFKVDMRRGVNKATDGAMCVVRPKFMNWGLTIELEFDASLVNPDTITALFTNASTGSGLCEFRPNKGGPFGCFEVKKTVGLEPLAKNEQPQAEAGEEGAEAAELPEAVAGRNGHGAPKTGEAALSVT
ncbi:MAG TPA: hypothetical protein VFA15_06010, partial [Nitrososphaera sp.]|nr:hypothetical protein [Nitrososphaera sp.]